MNFGICTAYRLEIEGLGVEAVTDPAMEQTLADGRQRIEGLLRSGLGIEEEVDAARAETESSGSTAQIVDRYTDNVWTQWLSQQPETRTWLASNASTGASSIEVASTEGFTAGDVIHVGTEAMLVLSVAGPTTLNIDTRGYWGTIAQAHYVSDGEQLVNPIVTLTRPVTIEGRRVRVYRYILGEDDLQGDGQQVWLGVATTDAALSEDGSTWSLRLDNILSILKTDLGSSLDAPAFARGIYHPKGLVFRVFEGTEFTDRTTLKADFSLRGFWESQADFVADLNIEFAAALGSMNASSFTAFEHESGVWGYRFTAGATAEWVTLRVIGHGAGVEGGFNPVDRTSVSTGDVRDVLAGQSGDAGSAIIGAAKVPRGTFGEGPDFGDTPAALPAEHPTNIYLGGGSSIDSNDSIEIVFGDPDDEDARRVSGRVLSTDTTLRYVNVEHGAEGWAWAGPTAPSAKIFKFYARGSVDDFRLALAISAPDDANRGDQPFVTLSDVASWADAIAESASGRPLILSRDYGASASIELMEMLSHEWRLAGVFPYLTSSGKIGVRVLRLPGPTQRPDFVLDETNILVDEQLPQFERNTFGSINVVEFQTGYNRNEDEHMGQKFIVRDVQALGTRKSVRKMEIAPKSVQATRGVGGGVRIGDTFGVDDAVGVASRVFGTFARPYSTFKVQVPYTLLEDALVGSVADITTHRMPNIFSGTRGVVGRKGLVVRRSWDFESERGELTLLLSDTNLGGYTPSAEVTANALVSGDTYDLTCSFNYPGTAHSMAPAGSLLSDFFTEGDEVEMYEFDSLTQTPQSGSIVSIDDGASQLQVEFDAAPTFTGTRMLRFAPATAITTTASLQDDWSFYGDDAAQVTFADGDKRTTEYH